MSFISLVFPVYNEADNLPLLHQRLDEVCRTLPDDRFEFIFVDDCSTDSSPAVLRGLNEKDKRVKVVRFARNCGSHAALAAGLNLCRGECAIVMAADLQDPPGLIPELLEKWRRRIKIIWGVRQSRKGETFVTKFLAGVYYRLMNWLTEVRMPPSGADVFLADRVVIDAYKQMTEKHTSVFMALAWLGFSQNSVLYVKQARHKGQSKWTLSRKFKLAVDSLLSFSDVPVRYMSVLGFLTAILGFGYALQVIWEYIFLGIPVQGWSSLIVAVLVVGGIQMMMLGVLGEYLWRTYDESRKRPRFVIEYTLE